jgi:hypothetical protein
MLAALPDCAEEEEDEVELVVAADDDIVSRVDGNRSSADANNADGAGTTMPIRDTKWEVVASK